MVPRAAEVRDREATAGAKVLGGLLRLLDELTVSALGDLLTELRPEVVVTHSPDDIHPDHQRIARTLLAGDEPLCFSTVIEEKTLDRMVGGPKVMRRQLQRLLELHEQPNIDLYVINVAVHDGLDGEFTLLDFKEVQSIAYAEIQDGAVYVQDHDRVSKYAMTRKRMCSASLSRVDAIESRLATARGLWSATRADLFGDLDRPAALLALRRGRLDVAESFAAVSVGRWEGVSQLGHTQSSIVLATIHVRAGEPRGLSLAHNVITANTAPSSAPSDSIAIGSSDGLGEPRSHVDLQEMRHPVGLHHRIGPGHVAQPVDDLLFP